MAWLVSLKIVLIASGTAALALCMKLYIPILLEFSATQLPLMVDSFKSLLRPPYLYVVINAIIITIAASSMFQYHDRPQPRLPSIEPESIAPETPPTQPAVYDHMEEAVINSATQVIMINESIPAEKEVEERGYEDKFEVTGAAASTATWMVKSDEAALPAQKPPVSFRFTHRKPARSTLEGGRQLRVTSKAPKRHDTLDSTWKAITEGRPMPLSRHTKKSDTWENRDRQDSVEDTSAGVMKSKKTFEDLTNQQQVVAVTAASNSAAGLGVKIRKEPSLSQDELNRRVEAFINKFNEDMRIQRQESLNQYTEMINRGSH